MFITVLGSCANQISDREGVSILVESNTQGNLLIDAGPGIISALGTARRKASEIDNVLLTHVHGDHTAGFPYFVWNRNYENMGTDRVANDLNVYGNIDTLELAQYSIEHSYPEITFPFKINYIQVPTEAFSCGFLSVITVPANHTVPNISVVIKETDKTVAYTSDTLPNDNLRDIAAGADLLIHEGMMSESFSKMAEKVKHSTAYQAGKFASEISAKELLMVHIAPSSLGNETQLIAEAAKSFQQHIGIPFDGSVYYI